MILLLSLLGINKLETQMQEPSVISLYLRLYTNCCLVVVVVVFIVNPSAANFAILLHSSQQHFDRPDFKAQHKTIAKE